MLLLYLSGVLAVASAVWVMLGKKICGVLSNRALDAVKADGSLGPIKRAEKELAVADRYDGWANAVEIVAIVLVAISVVLQTLDAQHEKAKEKVVEPTPVTLAQVQQELTKALQPLQDELARARQERDSATQAVNKLTAEVTELSRRVKVLEDKLSAKGSAGGKGKGGGPGSGDGDNKPKSPNTGGGAVAEADTNAEDPYDARVRALELRVDWLIRKKTNLVEQIELASYADLLRDRV
jgi:hypothetical protein